MKASIAGLIASTLFFSGLFWCMSIENSRKPKMEKGYVELEDPEEDTITHSIHYVRKPN